MALQFERMKLPPAGTMGGVSFHASDVTNTPGGPQVLLFGGQRQGLSGDLWLYEPTGDGWTQQFSQGAAPSERTQASLTAMGAAEGAKMILFGGYVANTGEVNEAWSLEMVEGASLPVPSWTLLECDGEAPAARYGHSGTCLGARLMVFGGQDKNAQFNDVWILDPASCAWSCIAAVDEVPMVPRSRHTATAVGADKAVIIGGFHRQKRALDDMWTLTIGDDGTLVTEEISPETESDATFEARAQHGAVAADGRHVMIFGGYDGAKNLNDLWVLNLETTAMKQVKCAAPPEPRSRLTMHMLGHTLHVFGGYDGWKAHAGDVFTAEVEDAAALFSQAAPAATGAESPARSG